MKIQLKIKVKIKKIKSIIYLVYYLILTNFIFYSKIFKKNIYIL